MFFHPRRQFRAKSSLLFLDKKIPTFSLVNMHRILHTAFSLLVLAAYVVSFTVTPAAHAHTVHDQMLKHHVHVQPEEGSAQKAHSTSCVYCVRVQSSAVVLTKVVPVGLLLPYKISLVTTADEYRTAVACPHCPGRAPPSPLS